MLTQSSLCFKTTNLVYFTSRFVKLTMEVPFLKLSLIHHAHIKMSPTMNENNPQKQSATNDFHVKHKLTLKHAKLRRLWSGTKKDCLMEVFRCMKSYKYDVFMSVVLYECVCVTCSTFHRENPPLRNPHTHSEMEVRHETLKVDWSQDASHQHSSTTATTKRQTFPIENKWTGFLFVSCVLVSFTFWCVLFVFFFWNLPEEQLRQLDPHWLARFGEAGRVFPLIWAA